MNLTYKTYAWIGLAGVILVLVSDLTQSWPVVSGIFSLLAIISSAVFIWAFVDMADKLRNNPLLIGSAGKFILTLLFLLFNIFSLFATLPIDSAMLQDPSYLMSVGIGLLVIFAVIFIIMGGLMITTGIGFLRLKDNFGGLATAAGILNIITGVSFATVFLFFIGLVTLLVTQILELIILFKADKRLN